MKTYILIPVVVVSALCIVGFAFLITASRSVDPTPPLQGVVNYLDTSSAGFTQSTTTVNTTATQIFATITKVAYLTNNTTSTLTCALEASNTTAASSTVVAGRGVIVGPNTSTTIPSVVGFGECGPGDNYCFRHKGAVNCVANTAATVTKSVQ